MFFYEDHLLLAQENGKGITEEMCRKEGEPLVRERFSKIQAVAYGEIEELRDETPAKAIVFGGVNIPIKHRLRLTERRKLEFTIGLSQHPTPRKILMRALGDRYLMNLHPQQWAACILMLLIGAIFGIVAWAVVKPGDTLTRMLCDAGAALFGLGALVMGWKSVPKWESANRHPTPEHRRAHKKRVAKGRRPFRSTLLGWGLKLSGLVYVFLAVSPLTDPVSKALERLQGQQLLVQFIWAVIYAPGALLVWTGYRMCQRPYHQGEGTDARRPILYLRPFTNDLNTSLQPKVQSMGLGSRNGRFNLLDIHPVRLFRMLFDIGVDTSEESFVRYFQQYGPVIAIGRPGEALAAPGAKRMYMTNETWQAAIAHEFERAQVVVIQPGNTEGVRWELEKIRASMEPQRVLVCLVAFQDNPQEYEALVELASHTLRVELPRLVPFFQHPCFVYFDQEWTPILQLMSYRNPVMWPLTGDAVDLNETLKSFMQGLEGGKREAPRPAQWTAGRKTVQAKFFGLLMGLAVVLGCGFLARWGALTFFPGFFDPAYAKEQVVLREVENSPKVRLEGVKLDYEVEVPEIFFRIDPGQFEHMRRSPDERMVFQVSAGPKPEDLSQFAATRVRNYELENTRVRKQSATEINEGSISWKEVQLDLAMQNGQYWSEICRVTSSPKGTVLLIAAFLQSSDSDPVYEKIAREAFSSFRFKEKK